MAITKFKTLKFNSRGSWNNLGGRGVGKNVEVKIKWDPRVLDYRFM